MVMTVNTRQLVLEVVAFDRLKWLLDWRLNDITEAARPHLSNGEFQDLEELLAEYEDIFAVNSKDHERTNK
jgi:hypothetical protein